MIDIAQKRCAENAVLDSNALFGLDAGPHRRGCDAAALCPGLGDDLLLRQAREDAPLQLLALDVAASAVS